MFNILSHEAMQAKMTEIPSHPTLNDVSPRKQITKAGEDAG
jgi:hypothetical protein